MLLNDFFFITHQELATDKIKARIRFNPKHKIFSGHFPDAPVVPGVCMVQIVREILESGLKKKFRISSADNIKFLSILNPIENTEVAIEITYAHESTGVLVNATIFDENITFFKLVKATLHIPDEN